MMKLNIHVIIILILCFGVNIQSVKCQDKGQHFFFIQLTDPQFGMYEKNAGIEKEIFLYEKAVDEVNRLKPDFVIITGDFVNNRKDKTQINEFKRITRKINQDIPVYLSPGNHDVGNKPNSRSIKRYIKNYGYDKFSFIHNEILFVGFNSSLIKDDVVNFEEKQYNWLKKILEHNENAQQVILFCHFPFFIHSVDEQESYSNISLEKRRKYLSLFKESNVQAIFSGHLHENASAEYTGIHLITTSALGKPLGDAPSGLRIVKVYDNSVEHHYFGIDEVPETVVLNNSN
ncbi:metallophosphoesterase [Draconibacterium halophilum]|uniref:Metallophosphatase n=1 Tax=Draconibacterium halophilum TaxID=2706887 RepID=A0A6C0RE57_9BACT|nr:metallophosphoesterase [Draconibacterium halophilum]QIA08347.1 metallophosphatase [Draconibacterium halophilum]